MEQTKTDNIKSNSEIASRPVEHFFIPSWAEASLYVLLSAIVLSALNSGSIIKTLSNSYISSPHALEANFSTLFDGFSKAFSGALGGRLGQILLWSFVGALAYILLWLAKNIINSFENDIISDHYLHPANYNRTGYWGSSLSVKVFLAAIVLISAVWILIAISAVLPSLAALAGSAIYKFHSVSVIYIIFAVIGGAMVFYISMLLIRLVSHLWKLL